MDALSLAPKVFDAAMKLVGLFRDHQDAREAEVRLLRVLYLEVCRNLGVLDRFAIEDREGLASTDAGYRGIAQLLSTEAHLAVVLVRDETRDDRETLSKQKELAAAREDAAAQTSEWNTERAEAQRAWREERLQAFHDVWGDLAEESWELEAAPGDGPQEQDVALHSADSEPDAPPLPSKLTTMLRSVAFVAVKVPTLETLCAVEGETLSVMRELRTAVRLEQIRQHESALKRRLETLPAVRCIRV